MNVGTSKLYSIESSISSQGDNLLEENLRLNTFSIFTKAFQDRTFVEQALCYEVSYMKSRLASRYRQLEVGE